MLVPRSGNLSTKSRNILSILTVKQQYSRLRCSHAAYGHSSSSSSPRDGALEPGRRSSSGRSAQHAGRPGARRSCANLGLGGNRASAPEGRRKGVKAIGC